MLLFAAPQLAPPMPLRATWTSSARRCAPTRRHWWPTNLQLTDAEAKAFWPVYDKYEKDLLTANNKLYQVVEEYALDYNANKLTDAKGLELIHRYFSAEEARTKVRESYLKQFSKVLPGLKVARFYQIENKLDAVVRYEMAAQIPLVKQ